MKDHIILALVRCVIASKPNTATMQQIHRLKFHCLASGETDFSDRIDEMLKPNNSNEPLKIVKT